MGEKNEWEEVKKMVKLQECVPPFFFLKVGNVYESLYISVSAWRVQMLVADMRTLFRLLHAKV